MSVIIGLNAFHADSAACLVIDGKLVGAVAEERLGERIKHDSRFPVNAIRSLLASSGLKLSDVTHIAIAKDPKANYRAKVAYSIRNLGTSVGAYIEHIRRQKHTSDYFSQLPDLLGEDRKSCNYQVVGVEHHLAHIASAYFLSEFDSLTAGFSYDASGDFTSAMAARCEGNKISVIGKVVLPDSLGFFYTAMCQFIGFDRFGEEYKVMGLAPYGEDKYAAEMSTLVTTENCDWFRLNRSCFGMHGGGASGEMEDDGQIVMDLLYSPRIKHLFGEPRNRKDPISQREMDIAKSTQIRFEQVAIACLKKLHSKVESTQLAMAGGCALNGVTNARILRDTPFESQYIQAAASDDGTSIGAAYFCWHNVLKQEERFFMRHAYWGPEYSDSEIKAALQSKGLEYTSCADEAELIELAASLIARGWVTGWHQGRSEWGPRALGNRSILAHPGIADMKETINSKIKRRESFRPFAPSVLEEDVGEYFEQTIKSPFMMHVVKIRPEWREKLPAVTHVDGTGRLQTVSRQSNALYYELITRFKQKTGLGVVLNTSFNENEPIVDTPEQAIDCYLRTDMDALCIGSYVLTKLKI